MGGKLATIQALRGLACLAVVVYHLAELEASFGLGFNPLRWALGFGFGAVDVFFVLSGFIIARSQLARLGRPPAAAGFLVRRLWRVYSTYWVLLAGAAGVVYLSDGLNPLASDAAADWWRAVVLLPPADGHQRWLPQAWTLSFELAFYLGFAALACMPRRVACVGFAGWFTAAVAGAVGWGHDRCAGLWFGPWPAEILAGVGIAFVPPAGGRRRAVTAAVAAVAWFVAGTLVSAHLGGRIAGCEAHWLTGPAAILLVYAAAAADTAGRPWSPRWLRGIGDAAYSIYLSHLTLQFLAHLVCIRLGLPHSRSGHLLWVGVCLVAQLGGGLLIHLGVERPLMRLAAGGPARIPAPAAVSLRDVRFAGGRVTR